jgi:Flp pilus assembly pilin Flp
MRHLITRVYAFLRDDRGQDLMEYSLLVTLIAILSIVAVRDVATEVSALWTNIVVKFSAVL